MIEIIGNFNTAKCFATTLEDGAREQIRAVCDTEAFSSSKIRIMPDVHAGKGCTIGTTMTITDKIVPSMVGVDIGCGMYTVYLGNIDIDFEKLDEAAHFIPSGRNVWEGRQERFDLTQLRCYRQLNDSKRLERSLGTLGGGNHFIEVDVDGEGGKYLVIHSGSRNLGTQVAEFYQQIAVDLNAGKEAYFKQREEIIRTYKEQGRRTEIQATIKALEKEFKAKEPTLPRDLCFLYDSFMQDYLHDVDICQKFAERNRAKMAEIILERCDWTAVETFQTIHNYIDVNEMILRKGAVSAKAGEKLLIPINMRDGSLICIGKGNEDWNCSAPHGAGRLMSRSVAFERLTMAEYEAEMAGIYSTCVVPDTLDESPMAYKSMDEIVDNIEPIVEPVVTKFTYNFDELAGFEKVLVNGNEARLNYGTLEITADGKYTVDVVANGETHSFSVTVDTKVDYSVTAHDKGFANSVKISANESVTATVTKNGEAFKYELGKEIIEPATYGVKLVDALGNKVEFSFTIVEPTVGKFEEEIDLIPGFEKVLVNGNETTIEKGTLALTESGVYEVSIVAGGKTHKFTVTVDATAPTLVLNGATNGGKTTDPVTLTDVSEEAEVKVFKGEEEIEYTVGDEISGIGSYKVVVTDAYGNSTEYNFEIEKGANIALIVILIILGVGAITAGAFFYFKKKNSI